MKNLICLTLGDFAVNTYLVIQNEQLLIVDPGARADLIIKEIEKNKINPTAILLTHGHLDHVGAIPELIKQYQNIPIYLCKQDSSHLGKGSYDFQYDDFAQSGMEWFVEKMLKPNEDLPQASNYFTDGEILFSDWKVIHTPGHTEGSCCFYNEKEKVLLSGDTLFFNSYGRTDLVGGSEQKMISSLKLLSKLPEDVVVFPGHGRYGFTIKENHI